MAFLPTNASQVQQFAVALYGIKVGTATMAAVQADITSIGGLNKALNSYYAASFGSSTTAAVSASVAANLGLTGTAAADAAAYITAVLNGTAASARGEAIMGVLSLFSTLTSNATFGAAATAWNAKVAGAIAYTGAADASVAAGSVAEGSAFTLTTGLDQGAGFVGTANGDTYSAVEAQVAGVATSVWTAGDKIDGGAGVDTLNVTQTAAIGAAPVGSTVANVEIVNLTSGANVALNTTTSTAGFTGLTDLTTNAVGGTALTTGTGINVTSTDALTAAAFSIAGGKDVTATLNGVTTGGAAITIGSATTAGAIKATVNDINTTAVAGTAFTVTGGTSQVITQTTTAGVSSLGAAVNATQGAVTATGGAATSAITVNQSQAVTGVAGVAAVTESVVATFAAVATANDVQSFGGLTVTWLGAATLAEQTALWANLSEGANANTPSVRAAAAAATGGATVTGQLKGYSTGAASNVGAAAGNNTLTFTSTNAGALVTDLAAVTAATTADVAVVVTQGVAAVTPVNGIAAGAVTIADVNAASTTAAGVLKTVTLANFGAVTANSSALDTVNLSGKGTSYTQTQGALTTATVTTENLNVTGLTTTGVVAFDTPTTTLNLKSSTTASTIASLTAANVTKLNVTGDALVTLTAHTLGSLTAVDASGSTGGVSMKGTALATTATFVGGSGPDSIQLGASTVAVNLGDGVNYAQLTAAAMGTGGTLASGAGTTDTLSMTNANATTATSTLALSAAFAGKVTGFERLEITAPGTNATPIDVAALLGATNGNFVTLTGGAFTTTLNNLGSGTAAGTLTVNATTAAGNTAVVLGGTTGAGSTDVLNLNLKDTTALGTVVAFGSVTAPNVETINLAVNDTRTTTVPTQALNTVTLVDTGLQNLNISGNQSVALAHTGTALTKLDASGLTLGNVTFTASALQYASVVTGSAKGGDILNFGSALAAVTITATAGTNTITGSSSIASTLTGGSGADFITGGSGADVINGGAGSDTIVAGAGANVITGGSGADLIVIAPTGVTPSATNFQTITDFNKAAGTSFDTIAASALILGTQTAAAAVGVATITAGVATFNAADTTFAQHLAAVAAALQTTAGATAIWQEGADSYLYIADNTLAVAATDTLVKLVGVTAGALTVAGNAITAVA